MDAISYYSGDPYGTGGNAFSSGDYANSGGGGSSGGGIGSADIANAFTGGGGVFGALGALTKGNMTAASLNTQAGYLREQAQEAETQGKYDAFKQQIMAGKVIGGTSAGYGAAGVSANSGSALAVMQASHMNAELDRLNILHGADLKAINLQNQAALDAYGAESAKTGAEWSAVGDIIGAAGNIAAGAAAG